jgi:anti-sigma factor ChrR (cupin superfamily)
MAMFEAIGGETLQVPDSGTAMVRAGGEWRESGSPGFLVKPFLEDAKAGLRTWLMKTEPGATAEMHAHDEIEQVYVLEGSFSDGIADYGPGDFIVRAPGAPHLTACPDGALSLVIYASADRGMK